MNVVNIDPYESAFLSFSDEAPSNAEDFVLSYLRIECKRHVGMPDFLMRVSSSGDKTKVTLRCNDKSGKADEVQKLVSTLVAEMQKKKDTTYNWSKLNVKHLGDNIAAYLKFFALNTRVELIQFSTDALK